MTEHSLIDQAGGEKRSAAAHRPVAVGRPWHMNAVSALDQHPQRSLEIFPLVGAIEGVGEQRDLPAALRTKYLGPR